MLRVSVFFILLSFFIHFLCSSHNLTMVITKRIMRSALTKAMASAPLIGLPASVEEVLNLAQHLFTFYFIGGGYPTYLLGQKKKYTAINVFCILKKSYTKENLRRFLFPKLASGWQYENLLQHLLDNPCYIPNIRRADGVVIQFILCAHNVRNTRSLSLPDFITNIVAGFDLKMARNVIFPKCCKGSSPQFFILRLFGNLEKAYGEIQRLYENTFSRYVLLKRCGFTHFELEFLVKKLVRYWKYLRNEEVRPMRVPGQTLSPPSLKEMCLGELLHRLATDT